MPTPRRQRSLLLPPFNPRQYGATFWLRADDVAGGHGASVSTWSDRLAGIAITQATGASQPALSNNGGPNNQPAVSFDGGDVLTAANISMLSLVASNQCHIYIVQYQDSTQSNNTTINWNQGVGNILNTHLTFSDTCYWDFGSSGGGGRINAAQPAGWDNAWRLVQLIREPPDSGTSRIRVQASELTSGAVSLTITSGTATLSIGGGNSALKGSIAEIIICNVAHDTAVRQRFERYFNARYKLF